MQHFIEILLLQSAPLRGVFFACEDFLADAGMGKLCMQGFFRVGILKIMEQVYPTFMGNMEARPRATGSHCDLYYGNYIMRACIMGAASYFLQIRQVSGGQFLREA